MSVPAAETVLYHWTTHETARAVLAGGFETDEELSSFSGSDTPAIDVPPLVGIWLVDRLPEPGDPYLDAVLKVTLPWAADELHAYKSVEAGPLAGWYVPAAVLNEAAHVEAVDSTEEPGLRSAPGQALDDE